MVNKKYRSRWVIVVSVIIAMMLMSLPIPDWAINFRPLFVAMLIIYWCMLMPAEFGIGISWGIGLIVDAQEGALLGLNALGFSVLAYITLLYYRQMRSFSLIQQAVLVFCYLSLYKFLNLWVKGVIGISDYSWQHYWLPVIASALTWPFLFIILGKALRKYIPYL